MTPLDISTLLAFSLTAGAIVLSPGPDTLLIIRNALLSGRAAGVATVIGVQLGLLVHTLLAIFGISLVIAKNPLLFKVVALAGALYLLWLGYQSFRGSGPGHLSLTGKPVLIRKAVRDAILCNLLNPKVIILFLALFPNFIDNGRGDVTSQVTQLALILVVINVLWQLPMALAAHHLRRLASDDRYVRWMAQATGVILIFFAGVMVVDHLL